MRFSARLSAICCIWWWSRFAPAPWAS